MHFLLDSNFLCCEQNFCTNIADVQISRDSPYHASISNFDVIFTSIFTFELAMNVYAHWLRPFLTNWWNALDVVIIILSLVALGPINIPISILRLVRAFRVIRLFGRMRALKRILSSLSASIVPELNAFLIFFIVASICQCPPHSLTNFCRLTTHRFCCRLNNRSHDFRRRFSGSVRSLRHGLRDDVPRGGRRDLAGGWRPYPI